MRVLCPDCQEHSAELTKTKDGRYRGMCIKQDGEYFYLNENDVTTTCPTHRLFLIDTRLLCRKCRKPIKVCPKMTCWLECGCDDE